MNRTLDHNGDRSGGKCRRNKIMPIHPLALDRDEDVAGLDFSVIRHETGCDGILALIMSAASNGNIGEVKAH